MRFPPAVWDRAPPRAEAIQRVKTEKMSTDMDKGRKDTGGLRATVFENYCYEVSGGQEVQGR